MNVLVITLFAALIHAELNSTDPNLDNHALETKINDEIDANQNNSKIKSTSKTLVVRTSAPIERDRNVFYSNNELKLTARRIERAADDNSSVIESTTSPTSASTEITTATGVTNTNSISNTTSTAKPSSVLPALSTGEPPPTHSAKLGMGLGITFIAIFIIIEIIYFQCFYRGDTRADNYIA